MPVCACMPKNIVKSNAMSKIIFIVIFLTAKLRRITNRGFTINSGCIAQNSYKHSIGHTTRIYDTNIIKLNDQILSSLNLLCSTYFEYSTDGVNGSEPLTTFVNPVHDITLCTYQLSNLSSIVTTRKPLSTTFTI